MVLTLVSGANRSKTSWTVQISKCAFKATLRVNTELDLNIRLRPVLSLKNFIKKFLAF